MWYLLAKDTIEGVDVVQDDEILDKVVEFLSPALGAVRTKKKGNAEKEKDSLVSDNYVLF